MASNGERPRANRVAARLPEALSLSSRGWLAFDAGQRSRALALFEEAFEADPANPGARAGLIRIRREALLDERDLPPTADERVLIETLAAIDARDWDRVRALEDALAEIPPGHLLFDVAAQARAAWRLEQRDPALAREALDLIDELLTRQRTGENYFQRARAGAVLGDDKLAWAALEHIAGSRFNTPALSRRCLALARTLGPPPAGSMVVARLNQVARRRR
jgi:tetratricopeptide (TPR) repeat protein